MQMSELFKIPNLLTLFRIVVLPLLFILAVRGETIRFVVVFIAAGLSDCLDGYMARKLKQESKLGNNLDSFADEMMFLSGIIFLYYLRNQIYREQIMLLSLFVLLYLIDRIVILNLRFRSPMVLHTIAGKNFQILYFITLPIILFVDNYKPFFFILMALGFYTVIEEIIIYFKHKKLHKGIVSAWT